MALYMIECKALILLLKPNICKAMCLHASLGSWHVFLGEEAGRQLGIAHYSVGWNSRASFCGTEEGYGFSGILEYKDA